MAGATRGAGRGIARALGEMGAVVYCTGRSSRAVGSTDPGRPETIEETAELVSAAGGEGVAVRVDHTDEGQVVALVDRIADERNRLDVLVNDIWGGDSLTEWGKRLWELDVGRGFRMMERAIHTHVITSRHAIPLMLEGEQGLVVEVTDGAFLGYRGQFFYDLCKASVCRMAYAMSVELVGEDVTSLAMTPGFLRSEAVLDHFGVTEETWREAIPQDRHFAHSETPLYVGRAIAALAADPGVGRYAGRTLTSWDVAREYGLKDADGAQPHWDEYLHESVEQVLREGSEDPDDVFLLRIRLHQLDFDPDRRDQRSRIERFLKGLEGD